MNTTYQVYLAEQSRQPIETRIARSITDKVRDNCCANSQCEGLCNVARHEYKMLWFKEWADYVRGN